MVLQRSQLVAETNIASRDLVEDFLPAQSGWSARVPLLFDKGLLTATSLFGHLV